jgi:hypothetical protein
MEEIPVLKRLSYVSRSTRPLTRDEITEITTQSQERNQKIGVTGMLLSSGGIFYQVLEGPPDEVDKLYQKIAADTRHKDVLMLAAQEQVEDRQFPSWGMKKVDLDEAAVARLEPIKALLEAIVAQRDTMQHLMRILSRSVWQELMGDDRTES